MLNLGINTEGDFSILSSVKESTVCPGYDRTRLESVHVEIKTDPGVILRGQRGCWTLAGIRSHCG